MDQRAERRELVGLADRVHGGEAGMDRAADVSGSQLVKSVVSGYQKRQVGKKK